MTETVVYLQIFEHENKTVCVEDFSYDLISYAKEISSGKNISGVVVLPENKTCDFSSLKKYGLDKLYVLRSNFPIYDKRLHPYLIIDLFKKINPKIFILNSTAEGREIAPIVASSLDVGLVADCTKLEIEENKLISTRPTFGGKLMASILNKKTPQMATVRVNTFKKKEFLNDGNLIVHNIESSLEDINTPNLKIKILDFIKDDGENFQNLQNAKVILSGGFGLKTKENFDKLKLLASYMGAQVGATRKAVDKGLIEKKYQIGQTGSTVTPEIYVAFGISGAIHHISGMENSKKIISINTDKNAPIFNFSDVGLVCDAEKILDEMLNFYAKKI